jgi:hypothetical protein
MLGRAAAGAGRLPLKLQRFSESAELKTKELRIGDR